MIRMVWKLIFGAVGLVLLFGIFGLTMDLGMYISGMIPLSNFGIVLPAYLTVGYTFLYNLFGKLPIILLGGFVTYGISYALYRSFT